MGESLSGGNRNTPSLPAFTAPAKPGKYRMRFKQDWSNIDPAGDADGKFGDFKENGGQIVDITLEVVGGTAVDEIEAEGGDAQMYDLFGRKVDNIQTKGIYIINNKKVVK